MKTCIFVGFLLLVGCGVNATGEATPPDISDARELSSEASQVSPGAVACPEAGSVDARNPYLPPPDAEPQDSYAYDVEVCRIWTCLAFNAECGFLPSDIKCGHEEVSCGLCDYKACINNRCSP